MASLRLWRMLKDCNKSISHDKLKLSIRQAAIAFRDEWMQRPMVSAPSPGILCLKLGVGPG